MSLTIGSIFSGVGGLEIGLERAGLGPVLWQAELDPHARAVLAKHWPDARRYENVKEIDEHAPRVDVICGGFPCQDISYAGKGAGLAGERSGLWFEFARIIRALRPRHVVVENVAALLVRGLDRVLGDLAEAGYDAEWTTLRAADVGAPHRRERLFLVAWRVSDADGGELRELTERGGLGACAADERDAKPIDVGAGLVAEPAGARREGPARSGGAGDGQAGDGSSGRGGVVADAESVASRGLSERAVQEHAGPSFPGGDVADRDGKPITPGRTGAELAPGHDADGCSVGVADAANFERGGAQRQPGHAELGSAGVAHAWPPRPGDADAWRRWLDAGGPAPVIDGTKLNPAFVEALMGFPPGWTEGMTRRQALRAIGNAVVPQCAEVIGRIITARLAP